MSDTTGRGRRRMGFRLVSATGADVVRPDRLDRPSRIRAMLPSLFTLANLLCGFSSVLATEADRFRVAAGLIGIAIMLDIADGAVARAVGSITPFGLQFDSLADLVSFGVAPAALLYTWALRDLEGVGWVLACYWLGCAAFRLARFNVTVDPLADKRYFIGLPSPGAAAVVLASVLAITKPGVDDSHWVAILLALVPATLMASSFRFRSFRNLVSPNPDRRWLSIVAALAVLVGIIVAPITTACAMAYAYVLLAPIGWVTGPLRRRWLGPDSVAPPRHKLPSVFFPTLDEPPVDDGGAEPACD